jgi:hypothetical protein
VRNHGAADDLLNGQFPVGVAAATRPDISILSDEFLAKVRDMDRKNLAIEALRQLLAGQVQSQGKRNVVHGRAFSERLEAAIAGYHNNALTTVEVLEELIELARDLRMARQRGKESGLSPDEIAFYDALADNQSARDVLGEPALRVIAHELMQTIRSNVTVDRAHRESARAHLRRLLKRILRKYGYPPDLTDAAVQKVLQQAEVLSAELSQGPQVQYCARMSVEMLCLNVRAGGGRQAAALIAYLEAQRPGILVLTEWRDNAAGSLFRRWATEHRMHTATLTDGGTLNGVFVASCMSFTSRSVTPSGGRAGVLMLGEFADFLLLACYFPKVRPRHHFLSVARRSPRAPQIGLC